MPVYINQPDAMDLIARVEGDTEGTEWRQHNLEGRMGKQSFQAFLDEWRAATAGRSAEELASRNLREVSITVDGGGAIYGWWGWNRYAVQLDGEIVFLQAFSRGKHCIEKALALGFTVR